MSHFSQTAGFSQSASSHYPVRSSQMFISGFVMQEPVTAFSWIKLKMLSARNSMSRVLTKVRHKNTMPHPLIIPLHQPWLHQSWLHQSWLHQSWLHQTLFEQVRQSKLQSYAGQQISSLVQFFKRADENGYKLQYAGLALLSVPALMQLGVAPFLFKPESLSDPIQTSSIVQTVKKNMWATSWKVKSGKALQIFSVEAPEISDLKLSYTTKTHVSGLQEDAMNWTQSEGNSAIAAAMIIQRNMPPQGYDSHSIFEEMTQRVTTMGHSLVKTSALSTVPSKFGPVEVVDMTIKESAQLERTCTAFRTQAHQPNLKLSGWLCSDKHDVVERPQITCFINRLDLFGAAESTPLRQIFLQAESRRGDCATKGAYTQDAARKANWLDIKGALPALKGAL